MKSSHNVLIPVSPCEPAAPWLGGKRHLSRRICALLAQTDHNAYAEPFVGMGGVFLRRAVRPKIEVINDFSGDLVNFYKVVHRHPEALFRELRWRPAMRAEFDRLKDSRDWDLTDIERAARFLYLQTLSFSGRVAKRQFGVDLTHEHNFNLTRLQPRLERLRTRLEGVVIENLNWSDFIERYDREGTLFYLDPPYWGCEGDYGKDMFSRGDFERLSESLRAIKGKFLLSINDRPEVRMLFDWADMIEIETCYSVGSADRSAAVTELLYSKGVNLACATAQARLL